MGTSWDPNDQVQDSLQRIVRERGISILSRPQPGDTAFSAILSDQFNDVPERTKELLKQAVEAGVADELNQKIESGLDPGSAVRASADRMVRTTPNDANGCDWVANEIVQALGYAATQGAHADTNATVAPVSQATQLPGATVAPDLAATQGVIVRPAQVGEATPTHGSSGAGRPGGPRQPVIIAVAVVVIVAIVAIVGLTRKSSSSPTTTTQPPATTTSTSPSTTQPTTTAGVPLDQLLPSDVDASQCAPIAIPNGFQGLVAQISCSPSTLTGGEVFAYQFDTESDYQTSFNALNSDVSFSSQGGDCQTSTDGGSSTWSNSKYPSISGQVIECYSIDSSGTKPVYVWTIPTEDAFIQAIGQAGAPMSDLYNWWHQSAGPYN